MGKRNLITGAVLGAIAGGLISLISKDTRNYVSEQISLGKDKKEYMLQNITQTNRNKGAVLGEIEGVLISLIIKDTRNYVSEQISLGKDQMGYIVQNPTQSIRNIQSTIIETAESAASSLDGALNAVDQVESTINDIRKEDQQKLN